ncbi:MAG: M48 family metallopeptidase [Rhizobiaceae bacterium]|nr:M48 family metallopeptidase [Rhizobiaceae bacterium]
MSSFRIARIAAARTVGRSLCALLLSCAVALSGAVSASAQNLPIVRDAEIEALVRDYARPLLAAAGLTRKNVEIVLVNNPGFNAFVSGRRIFMNTGTLMIAETPNEVIGVLAHEIGHLAGGHQERLRLQVDRAKTLAIVGMLLGMGTLAAGAATKQGELGGVGMGMATGSTEVARRSLLAYQRTEETAADRSALTYLEATQQSARGMLRTFKRFQSALALSGTRVDPYQISHPTPRDRIANLEVLARKSPYYDKRDAAELQQRHDRARAKIAAFTNGKGSTQQLFRQNKDVEAKNYGEAIEGYLHGNPRAALAKIDALIKAEPKNPYHYELRGDTLMKANRPREAAEAYARAIKLDPSRSSALQISYGQALLAQGKKDTTRQAIQALQRGLAVDPENTVAYRYLAQAHGQLGDIGQAELASADGYFYSGNIRQAKIFAARAQLKLKPGSAAWQRAQDIINYRKPRG